MNKPSCVSLFSGGMGLDLGLESAGFQVLFASDNMAAAVQTAHANRPDLPYYDGDVRALSAQKIAQLSGAALGNLDLLAGGPPCQSFSTAGKRLSLDDAERGLLVFQFVRLLDELRPRAFILENVKGLLSASLRWRELPYNNNGKVIDDLHGSLFRELMDRFKKLGYNTDFRVMNAADFGVPQSRLRVFIVGYRDGEAITFPQPTHCEQTGLFCDSWRTVGDALADLRNDDSHCARFSERKLRYLKMVPEGGNWRDLPEPVQRESMGRAFYAKGGRSGYWRRLAFNAPSPTILTEPQNASTALCHPREDRPLTVRECARIQTFPDSWHFHGRGADQYKLVGNAVPILLAAAVGKEVRRTLSQSSARVQDVDALSSSSAVDPPEELCVI